MSIFILLVAAFIGSTFNAVAGGGSFFTYPALIFTGVPILNANATSTFALWPGTLASAYTYRNEMLTEKNTVRNLIFISILGGSFGTILLLNTSDSLLQKLLPFLMLSATFLLAFKNKLKSETATYNPLKAMAFQFFIATYGGYFGGGMGILMLATFSLMGFNNLATMNALKTFLACFINGVAVIIFSWTHQIFWQQAVIMCVAGIAGGYWGVVFAKSIPSNYLNKIIIATGFIFSVIFFVKAYL